MYWLSVLSVLAAIPLGLATPISPRWDDMRLKHSWESIPENWECQGHPPVGTTIDLRVALKPHREDALIDALHEVSDPRHLKYVFIPLLLRDVAHTTVYLKDTVRTYPRSKLPSSSLRTRTHSSSSAPGLHTMRFHLLRFRSRMAGIG